MLPADVRFTPDLRLGLKDDRPRFDGSLLVRRRVPENHVVPWWTAALDLKARPANAGVFEYGCHEGTYGMSAMLSAARYLEQTSGKGGPRRPAEPQ